VAIILKNLTQKRSYCNLLPPLLTQLAKAVYIIDFVSFLSISRDINAFQ